MASAPLTRFTEEEYLRLERAATRKSEFHDGEIVAMSGGSPNHSLLSLRISIMLDSQAPEGCTVYNSEMPR
jgi:Uma2 family endonuclease